ncbi:hypothetical protein DXG01_003859 [Tephrocybe rancida]|nr:hypothetical protein DXG01_003859 [Tephrocybe rancida]
MDTNELLYQSEPSKPRGPPKAYVVGLEDKMEQLETLLKQLHPNKDYSKQLGPPVIRNSWKNEADNQQPHWASALPAESKLNSSNVSRRALEDPDQDSSDDSNTLNDVLELESISGMVQKLTLRGEEESTPREQTDEAFARFHGKSSSVGLVGVAQAYKMMHMLEQGTKHDARLGSPDSISTSSTSSSASGPSTHRPKFWKMPERERQWEERSTNTPDLIAHLLSAFPPVDLVPELIRVYFVHSNVPLPLLHRPTFERQWNENLHHTNAWFAAVCLGVFSIASRWSNDTRVIPDGARTASGAPDWSLAGWTFCKAGLAWVLVGSAIRKAQDLGVHRKRVYQFKPTVDSELWKRAFWCLLVVDRFESAAVGRSALVGEEDFDVDLPLEVDDEYWEADDPGSMFMQPKGKPANTIISFNQLIKLSRVLAFTLKTLYAVDRKKISAGLSPSSWRKAILEHLEAALQKWYKSLPEHLAWLKQKEGSPFAADAAALQTTYRLIEMLIYQMFIPDSIPSSPSYEPSHQSRQSPSEFSPLDICVDAARDCARISQKQSLEALSTWSVYIYAAQVASSILLVKIYSIRLQEKTMRSMGVEDIKPPMLEPLIEDLRVFLRILELAESRWGFISAYLQELRQALPNEVFDGLATFHPKSENASQLRTSQGNVEYRVMEPQEASLHPVSYLPSYPNSITPSQQLYSQVDPYHSSSLLQSQPVLPSQGSQQRISPYSPPSHDSSLQYSSHPQYSSSPIAPPPTQPGLAFNNPTNIQRLRTERSQQFLPPVPYVPAEYRSRQYADNASNLVYNSGPRRIDEGLELPSPYDRTRPLPPRGDVVQTPSLPRTLQPARPLSYLDNSMPFSTNDINFHGTRERQKTVNGRELSHNVAVGFDPLAVRQAQDSGRNAMGATYPHSVHEPPPATGPFAKQHVRHSVQPQRIPPDSWPQNPSKDMGPAPDSENLYRRN